MSKLPFTECVEIVGSAVKRFEGEKKYVSTGAVERDHIDYSQVESVTYDKKPSRANLIADSGDVLFAKMQGTKKTIILDDDTSQNIFSTGFCAVRPIAERISGRCLYHLLGSGYFLYQKDKFCSGATQKAISNDGLKKIVISVPDKAEQEKIADRLDKTDIVILKCQQILSVLNRLVRARFLEMFGDPVLNPKGWETALIRDIVTDVKYGTSRPSAESGKYPYLRMNNITYDGYLDLTELKRIDIPDNETEKCIARKGDVLFNRTNSAELVGKTCVFNEDEDMIIAGYIIRVRLKPVMLPVVLSCFMNTDALKMKLKNMAKGAVNQANINARELQDIEIYLPPQELQKRFSDFAEKTEKSKAAVKQTLEKAETLKKALVQEYFG